MVLLAMVGRLPSKINQAQYQLRLDKVTTVGTAYKYTGTFTPIYQLSVNVTNNADGSFVKQYPQVFSRNYDLVRPLFEGDGTPIQRIGRTLVCGVPA